MFKKVFSYVVIASMFAISGCAGLTATTALGTVGSAAATKAITHASGSVSYTHLRAHET